MLNDLCRLQHENELMTYATAKPDQHQSLLFVGPLGCGKRTRVRAFLRQLYQDPALDSKTTVITTSVKELRDSGNSNNNSNTNTNNDEDKDEKAAGTVKISYLASPNHIWIRLSDFPYNAHVILCRLVGEIQGKPPIQFSEEKTQEEMMHMSRTVVIDDAQDLCPKSQKVLLNLIERMDPNAALFGGQIAPCRFVLISDNVEDALLPALQSRLVKLRFVMPNSENIAKCLTQEKTILKTKTNFKLSHPHWQAIIQRSGFHLEYAMQNIRLAHLINENENTTTGTIASTRTTTSNSMDWSNSSSIPDLGLSSSSTTSAFIVQEKPFWQTLVETNMMMTLRKIIQLLQNENDDDDDEDDDDDDQQEEGQDAISCYTKTIHEQVHWFVENGHDSEHLLLVLLECFLKEIVSFHAHATARGIDSSDTETRMDSVQRLAVKAAEYGLQLCMPGVKKEIILERFCFDYIFLFIE